MCLGIPGKVVRWLDRDPVFGRAEVEFDGVRRPCHMACVNDALEGDYVIVHAGIAISRIDENEAQQVLEALASMEAFAELQGEQPQQRGQDSPAAKQREAES